MFDWLIDDGAEQKRGTCDEHKRRTDQAIAKRMTSSDGADEFCDGSIPITRQGGCGFLDETLPMLRRVAVEAGIGQHAERMNVGFDRDFASGELLRRGVADRSEPDGFPVHDGDGFLVCAEYGGRVFDEPEVDENDSPVRASHDVCGLQVPVDIAHPMKKLEGIANFKETSGDVPVDIRQIARLKKLHRKPDASVFFAEIEDARKMLVVDDLENFDFAHEASVRRFVRFMQDFDGGDPCGIFRVYCSVDFAAAAARDESDDLPASECRAIREARRDARLKRVRAVFQPCFKRVHFATSLFSAVRRLHGVF